LGFSRISTTTATRWWIIIRYYCSHHLCYF